MCARKRGRHGLKPPLLLKFLMLPRFSGHKLMEPSGCGQSCLPFLPVTACPHGSRSPSSLLALTQTDLFSILFSLSVQAVLVFHFFNQLTFNVDHIFLKVVPINFFLPCAGQAVSDLKFGRFSSVTMARKLGEGGNKGKIIFLLLIQVTGSVM